MRISYVATVVLACLSFGPISLAEDVKKEVTPSTVALDFISTVFFDRNTDRIEEFCNADAKRHRMLEGGKTVAAHLKEMSAQLSTFDELQLKHMHLFRKSDFNAEFLKMVMPKVEEPDMVKSFQPFADAMKDGFCCIVVFDLIKRGNVRPYMFFFAFAPSGKSYKISLMYEGSPG